MLVNVGMGDRLLVLWWLMVLQVACLSELSQAVPL